MVIKYFLDFHQRLDQILNDYELDNHNQRYSEINTADPSWFDEQIQFYNDMKVYCVNNGYKEISELMSSLKPYYKKSRLTNFFRQHSSPEKANYLRSMLDIVEKVINYLQLANKT